MTRVTKLILISSMTITIQGCTGTDPFFDDQPVETNDCSVDPLYLTVEGEAQVKDGISALTDPPTVSAAPSGQNAYLDGDGRILGVIRANGQPLAVPYAVLRQHEVVNLGSPDFIAITHAPLTGSGAAFDRLGVGGEELGHSGILYQSNSLLYNRGPNESNWTQITGLAICGAEIGRQLVRVPVIEMTWDGWKSLYPNTEVVSSAADPTQDYSINLYAGYETSPQYSFPMPTLDPRRQPKELVLGLAPATGTGLGTAVPFLHLATYGLHAAVQVDHDGTPLVVFWDGARASAMAYSSGLPGQPLTFDTDDQGIFDVETGSRWTVDGVAQSGQLAGGRLTPFADAIVAYWGAWSAFYRESDLWLFPPS